jgi:hypothetical protein
MIKKEVHLKINGVEKNLFAQKWLNEDDTSDNFWLYSENNDGIYFYGGISKNDTLLFENIDFKYPVNINNHWNKIYVIYTVKNTFEIIDTIRIECLSLSTQYNTPIGVFDCIKYRSYRYNTFTECYTEYYLSKNVGLIGLEIYTNDSLTQRRELIDYNLSL